MWKCLRMARLISDRGELYRILNIPATATQKQIKEAYFKLAKKYHPDACRAPDAKQKFAEVKMAYETLGIESKKRQYDEYRNELEEIVLEPDGPIDASSEKTKTYWEKDSQEQMEKATMKEFEELFKFSSFASKGKDINIEHSVSILDLVRKKEHELSGKRYIKCSSCGGLKITGDPQNYSRCNECGGTGFSSPNHSCSICHGLGYAKAKCCPSCQGTGLTLSSAPLLVTLPEYVESGQIVKFIGLGHHSPQGPSGDLIVKIILMENVDFLKDGLDVISTLELSFPEAALGCTKTLSTIRGIHSELIINPGTQSGDQIVLKSQGLKGNKLVGDHIVNIKITTPTNLSQAQKTLLQEFHKMSSNEPLISPSNSFLLKLRRFLHFLKIL